MIEGVIGFVFSEYGLATGAGIGTYRMFMDKRPFLVKTGYSALFLGTVAHILNLV